MADLSPWDFAEDFDPFAAAALIVGIEPDRLYGTALQDPATLRNDKARMMELSKLVNAEIRQSRNLMETCCGSQYLPVG